jgi:hypothetical protein
MDVKRGLALREEHRLRVFENRVSRRVCGPRREEMAEGWRRLKMKDFITCTLHQISLGLSGQEG